MIGSVADGICKAVHEIKQDIIKAMSWKKAYVFNTRECVCVCMCTRIAQQQLPWQGHVSWPSLQ